MKKLLIIGLAFVLSLGVADAQKFLMNTVVDGSGSLIATVTNAGTTDLYVKAPAVKDYPGTSTVIQWNATETSGTTAGVVTLIVSNDGVNWKPAQVADAVTAIYTITATDVASQSGIWRITGAPYLYYGLRWVGTGTMVDTFTGSVYVH